MGKLNEMVAEAIKRIRKEKGDSLAKMGRKIGKSEDAVSRWEKGKTDVKLSDVELLATYAGCSVDEFLFGKKEKVDDGTFEIEIYGREDRLNVAKILIDSGYAVQQGKRQKTPTGKQVTYFLTVSKRHEDFMQKDEIAVSER